MLMNPANVIFSAVLVGSVGASTALCQPYAVAWTRNVDHGVADDLAIDSNGDMYLAGSGLGKNTGPLVKLNSNGNEIWSLASVDGYESAVAVAVHEDHPILFGQKRDSLEPEAFFLRKYNQQGNVVWSYENCPIVTPSNGCEWFGASMAVNSDGSIVLAGNERGSTLSFVTKIDADGNELWTRSFVGRELFSLDVDRAGSIYLTSREPVGDEFSRKVSKLAETGMDSWTIDTNLYDFASHHVIAEDGMAYVGGISEAGTAVVKKYDAEGTFQWENEAEQGVTLTRALAVDNSGNLFTTGIYPGLVGPSASWGHFVNQIGDDGEEVWRIDQRLIGYNMKSISVADRDLIVAGGDCGPGGCYSVLAKYSPVPEPSTHCFIVGFAILILRRRSRIIFLSREETSVPIHATSSTAQRC